MSKIKIVTDSTADIPAKISEELGITVLPIPILDGNKEYKDGVDMTAEEFYTLLENSEDIPTTSRIAPTVYGEVYENAYKDGFSDVILTCINSKGSSTIQGAVMARNMFYEDNPEAKDKMNIHIIDSKSYTMAYGMIVIESAKMAEAGKNADEIVEAMNAWLEKVKILFIPMNLKYVKKSGRVSAAAAFVGDALGLKPIITFDEGESKILSKIRGDKKAVSAMVDMVCSDRDEESDYSLVYGNNKEALERLKTVCGEKISKEPKYIYNMGAVISINSGPDVVGVIYKTK